MLLGFFCFLLITGTFRRFSMGKIVQTVQELPIEKKFVSSNKSILKILKIFLFMIPLNMIAVPYFVYKYEPVNCFHIFVLESIAYVLVTDDVLFRRSILKRLKET